MPDNSSTPPIVPVINGQPLREIDRTTVANGYTLVPTTPPDISFWTKDHVGEIFSLLGGLGAVWVYFERKMDKKKHADKETLDARLKPIEERIENFKPKEQIAAKEAAVDREIADLKHDVAGARQGIAALDRQRQESDQWRASVNTTLANFKEGQQRMETAMKENHKETLDRIEVLIDSIRETRIVGPK